MKFEVVINWLKISYERGVTLFYNNKIKYTQTLKDDTC